MKNYEVVIRPHFNIVFFKANKMTDVLQYLAKSDLMDEMTNINIKEIENETSNITHVIYT